MKQKIIGFFPLGPDEVQLVLREGNGGEFYIAPEPGHVPRIKVGADQPTWDRIVMVLLHEALELALFKAHVRFDQSHDYAQDSAAYIFVMDHTQYAEAVARCATFITPALPALSKEWNKWRKKK
jgi:hypothetical protein